MFRLLIMADDLSGAADCAAACVTSGFRASVALDDSDVAGNSEILSIDCNTRHLKSDEAAVRVGKLIKPYAANREILLYKKLDSTLRGNIAAELDAMVAIRRRSIGTKNHPVIVMAPALPSGVRTTVGGHQFIHGVPLQESETWKQYQSPGPTHIPSMLESGGLRALKLNLEIVRSESHILKKSMEDLVPACDAIVCDAQTDEDLRAIASTSLELDNEVIWAGSAGLAYHLSGVLRSRYQPSVSMPLSSIDGPVLIVVGSMSSVAKGQIEMLTMRSAVTAISVAPHALIGGSDTRDWQRCAMNLEASLKEGRDVLVTLKADQTIELECGRLLSQGLGIMMAPHVDSAGALVASGGETARAILDAWGVKRLRMIEEIEPGLPLAVTEGSDKAIPVVTKAGAFGDSHTLVRCWQSLRKVDRAEEIGENRTQGVK